MFYDFKFKFVIFSICLTYTCAKCLLYMHDKSHILNWHCVTNRKDFKNKYDIRKHLQKHFFKNFILSLKYKISNLYQKI